MSEKTVLMALRDQMDDVIAEHKAAIDPEIIEPGADNYDEVSRMYAIERVLDWETIRNSVHTLRFWRGIEDMCRLRDRVESYIKALP